MNEYEVPQSVMTKRLGEELVLVDLDSGQYYTLNPSGTLIWENLGRFETVAALSQFLARETSEELDTVRADVEDLLEELTARKLLRRK
jgi:hypothetical protein